MVIRAGIFTTDQVMASLHRNSDAPTAKVGEGVHALFGLVQDLAYPCRSDLIEHAEELRRDFHEALSRGPLLKSEISDLAADCDFLRMRAEDLQDECPDRDRGDLLEIEQKAEELAAEFRRLL